MSKKTAARINATVVVSWAPKCRVTLNAAGVTMAAPSTRSTLL